MPEYGVPGGNPLDIILQLITPAIGTALYNINRGTAPVRDYFIPNFGMNMQLAGRGARRLGDLGGALSQGVGDLATRGIQEAMTTAFDTAHGVMPYTIPDALRPRFNPVGTSRSLLPGQPFGTTSGGEPRTLRQAALGDAGDLAVAQAQAQVGRAAQGVASYAGDVMQQTAGVPRWLLEQMRRPINPKLAGKARLPTPPLPNRQPAPRGRARAY